MMPNPASVDPALQIGKGMLAAVRKANAPNTWPNVYESLVELYVILDEWCEAEFDSNYVIMDRVRTRRFDETKEGTDVVVVGLPQTSYFVSTMLADSEHLLRPGAPWLQKWSKSKRRSAARRSLAGILAVHAPALLESFKRATSERAEWVRWREQEFELWFKAKHSAIEENDLMMEMQATGRRLEETRDALGAFVNDTFPLASMFRDLDVSG